MKDNLQRALVGLVVLLYVGSSSGQEIPKTFPVPKAVEAQAIEKTAHLKVIWKKTYEPSGAVKKGFVVADPLKVSDGFVIGLYVYGEQETFLAGELLKVGFDGNVVWQHPVPYQDINYLIEYNKGYLFTGTESNDFSKPRRSMVLLDKQGNVLHTTNLQDERFYDAFPAEVKEPLVTYVTPPKYCMKNICRGVKGVLEITNHGVSVKNPMQAFTEFKTPSSITSVDPYGSQIFLDQIEDGWLLVSIIRDEKDRGKDLSFPRAKISDPFFIAAKFGADGSLQWTTQYMMPKISWLYPLVGEAYEDYIIFTAKSTLDVRKKVNNKIVWKRGTSNTQLFLIDKKKGSIKMRSYSAPMTIHPRLPIKGSMIASISRGDLQHERDTPSLAMVGPSGEIQWEQRMDAPLGIESGVQSVHKVDGNVFLFGNLADKFAITKLKGIE